MNFANLPLQTPLTSRMNRQRSLDGAMSWAMELSSSPNIRHYIPSIDLILGSHFLNLGGMLNLEIQGPAAPLEGVSKLSGPAESGAHYPSPQFQCDGTRLGRLGCLHILCANSFARIALFR